MKSNTDRMAEPGSRPGIFPFKINVFFTENLT